MRKAEGGSCLDHIVPSSQIEALNTTYQSGKYFDCILGVYAYTHFSMFTTFVCLRKFLKQDKLYRVWTWTNSTLLDVIFLYVVLGLDLIFYKVCHFYLFLLAALTKYKEIISKTRKKPKN